ncbi:MAG: c-type cytochrome biogenesis protein CcmI, partial [Pseudomonadota bacterium]
MIWGIGLALIVIAGLYLMRPFLAAAAPETASALDQARQQRAAIDLDAEAGRLNPQATEEARDALDRRILALLDEQDQSPAHARLKSLAM